MNDTVITPLLHGSRAVELANGTWRKKLLPIGSVEYQGRTLHFTKSYLAGLVAAWNDQAYDQIPLQFADESNRHTNDPERTRGWITDMELGDDGLYIQAELTDRGEQVLQDNPYLGVSARIVENYNRSDGKFYPAAVQHVLGTLDPRVPGLGSWERLDMSNGGGGVIIDLSGYSWAGEPTGPDTSLTDAELAEFLEAIDEADAEMVLNSGYQYDQGAADALSDFDATFQHSYAAEAAREQARGYAEIEDLTRPVIRDEDIMARAMSRIESGIYDTSRVSTFANQDRAIDLTAQTGAGLCGDPDPFGRCSSRYHDLQCIHGISTDWQASEPPRSTYATALSNFASAHETGPSPAVYGDGEDSHPIPARTLELAHRLNESWGLHADTAHLSPPPDLGELTGLPYAGDPYAAMASELGRPDLAGEQPQYQDYPDVSAIRARLGV